MMYGFGDDATPYKESVDLVEVNATKASPRLLFFRPTFADTCVH